MSVVSPRRVLSFMGSLLVVGGVFAWKFYDKSDYQDKMKKEMVKICAEDSACVAAVNEHFNSCFELAYSIGGRRHSGGLNEAKFLKCFNDKSGEEYFTFSEDSATEVAE